MTAAAPSVRHCLHLRLPRRLRVMPHFLVLKSICNTSCLTAAKTAVPWPCWDEQEQQQQQRHSCDESAVVNDDEELLEVMPAMENHGELDTEFDLSARTAGAAQCDNGHLEFALSIAVLQDPFSSGSEQWVMECGGKNTMNLTVANGAGAGGAARSAEGTGQPAKLIHDHPHWTRGECWHDSWMMKALAKAHAPSALMDKGRCPQNVDDGMPWRSEEHRKSLLETAEGCNSEHQDA
mmetsp:Transcript_26327/g.51582  ORF Transcript_26327/g.51582 Transcript_26327/m.51582 type:complete len:236 (+) Transcript_26327:70-777(+)